jgi:PKD repeat protein
MKKHSTSEAAAFNPRIFVAFLLCSIGLWLAMFSVASTPSSGTLTTSSGPLNYSAGPFTVSNATPVPLVDSGPTCNGTTNPCDNYTLSVQLPSGYAAANPNAVIKVTMSWTDTGAGASDYDLYIYKGVVGNTSSGQSADAQSASGNNPEVANIGLSNPQLFKDDGSLQQYSIKIVPYTATGETVHVTIELVQGAAGGGGGGGGTFGGVDPAAPGQPRYQIFAAPPGSSAESSQGEFNIGYNPHSGRIMVMNIGPIWRLTPPELLTPAKPECCESLWEDQSATVTETGLDPILWTDQLTGRTFASNFTAGANALYAYSDNDGDAWIEVGAGSPNGGADHETIGSGPYPNSLPYNTPGGLGDPNNAVTHGHAVYYCSQDIVGPAACYRSDTLGASWGPLITLPYKGQNLPVGSFDPCGGLHGHLHVAPDGTVWLPVSQCTGQQGGSFSTDGGNTWTEFQVPNNLAGAQPATGVSQTQGADPSIAIDANSKIYYAYVNSQAGRTEGHARVAVGTLACASIDPATGARTNCSIQWGPDIDIGSTHGVINAAEIEAVGGDNGRAAVGFLGTNVGGDYQAGTFPGKWYAFIATTYDGGQTWTTVNATPNDPVQSMTGIWQQGGSGQNGDRNLLDFNEITVDSKGHALYGFSDGCVTQGCIDGSAGNDKVGFMRVARQTGGKSLYAANDTNTDLPGGPARVPKPPCLSGSRSTTESLLTWKAPDNGGANITNYKIYRSNVSGGEVFLGQTGSASTTFRDQNPTSDTHLFYRVTAVNSVGEGMTSNEIDLVAIAPPPAESACVLPGLTILRDNAGDTSVALGIVNTPAPAGSDLLSFQLAQPFQSDNVPRLVFTITTDPNPSGTAPTASAWYVALKIPGPDPAIPGDTSTVHYRGVHMAFTTPTTPIFESYTPSPNSSGGVDGRFVKPNSQIAADAGSHYDAPNGKITIIVKASDLTLAPAIAISGFVSGVSQSTDAAHIGAGATFLYDQMPDSLAFAGTYTVNSGNTCTLPTAVLTATPTSGRVPLTVNFSGAGSSDADPSDTIASYRFSFGDGAAAVTQSGPTISHSYGSIGTYTASLTVTDSRGVSSSNSATQTITVTKPTKSSPTPTPSPSATVSPSPTPKKKPH